MKNDLADEKVTRHDITRHCEVANRFPHWVLHNSTRHCEEGERSAARRGNLLNGLLRHFVVLDFDNSQKRGFARLDVLGGLRHTAHLSKSAPRNDENRDGNPPTLTLPLTHFKKAAFTLAEVLITLGVIGIVAAMTIPTLVNNYKTQVNIVKIKKFYSMFNQAIKLSEVDNGSIDNWFLDCGDVSAPTCTIDEVEAWYNNYLGKYIKNLKIEKDTSVSSNNNMLVYLPDGSLFFLRQNVRDMAYCPDGKNKYTIPLIFNGKSMTYVPQQWVNCSSYLDTYCYGWDGTREGLIEGRNYAEAAAKKNSAYCTKLLQYDGWVVKDDNPCKYY